MARARKVAKIKIHRTPIRVSMDFKKLVDRIRARAILQGKKPPSISKISNIIAKKIKEEDILKDEFIQF